MERRALAIVGFGRLGHACAHAAADSDTTRVVGVLRHPESPARLEAPFSGLPVATHLRELPPADAALLCVPAAMATGIGREILQLGTPLVECAMLGDRALTAHYAALDAVARHHRVAAVVGAGWDPGVLPLIRRAFELLIPAGHTFVGRHPATLLHHTEAAANVPGVAGALATESRDADGRMHRYVYAQLARGADAARVGAALDADPLFAGAETHLFVVPDIAALEAAGQGVLLERRGSRGAVHPNLLLEARFDAHAFAARAMLDAALSLPSTEPGAHAYTFALRSRSR